MIAARVKQTRNVNRKQQVESFQKDDLVYLSTKNIKSEKGLVRNHWPLQDPSRLWQRLIQD
jgi:hypothetical protein